MSDCKKCKWRIMGKSGTVYCLASEEENKYGEKIVNALSHDLVSDEEWVSSPCIDYAEA